MGSTYNVQGYPTLIYFKNNEVIKFGGSRNLEFMTFWLGKKTLPPIVPVDSDKLVDLETNGKINIVFYGDLSSEQASILTKVASADDYNSTYLTMKCIIRLHLKEVNLKIQSKSLDHSPKVFKIM